MRRDAIGQREQADDVLQQAAEPGVMKLLGGRSFAVRLSQGGVVEHRGEQALQVGVGEARDKARSCRQSSATS